MPVSRIESPEPVLSPAMLEEELARYINLKLVALGQPSGSAARGAGFLELARPLLRNYQQKDQLLGGRLCPSDTRIQNFLDSYLAGVCPDGAPRLPSTSFVLDRPGLARILSFPPDADSFCSPYLSSYRVAQGALHNPASDRRTTKGVFHIVEGGLPIPADKLAAPQVAFARLLAEALHPPREMLALPFTAGQTDQAHVFLSLLLRPKVCPAIGCEPARSMETRFFAPASLVSNLDFVEAIFGNAGDPYLPENDAALDVPHWTGHTGCVILAPHLVGRKKKDLGLPHYDQAGERARRDGMCWRDENEIYNDGLPFKIVCRDFSGAIVTILTDNYFGYCKKEVKSQISFSANLYGLAEEEHAGGAIAFPSYILGQDFAADRALSLRKTSFEDALRLLDGLVERQPEGYAVDRADPGIFYVPGNAKFNVREGTVRWTSGGLPHQTTLLPEHVYVLPSGYKVRLEKQHGGTAWRLVGSVPHGTLCHKPCTVSGGGKSEISKSILSMVLNGPVFVKDYSHDFEQVEQILARDYSTIYKRPQPGAGALRPILGPERSLGSVIKLLTPSAEYTDEYNQWLRKLPQTIRQLIFTVKRYYRPEWGAHWRQHFTVDRINGYLGHELKYENQKLVGNYLRVGFDPEGSWRIYKLRPDFRPADKVQVEDDITASAVVPRERVPHFDAKYPHPSLKLVENCEAYLFQRPDDAVVRGFDAQAEADIATPGTFLSNFEPLGVAEARSMVEHVVEFDRYTAPMKELLRNFVANSTHGYVVSSAHARLVDGKRSKNPRYLERRPDLVDRRGAHLAQMCARLDRAIPAGQPVQFPVNAVLAGRRGNPADASIGLPPLAVHNPVHYQELPELFMDFVASLTGKSPSTTGFGSEGALTKGPFNALWPVVDLNNALVGAILTGYAGFTTAAGWVGPLYRVDHDMSMLAPEVWCRIRVEERDPRFLIENGYLEKLEDFDYQGRTVHASRLGYRITAAFAERFLGRIFETPNEVFTEEMLRPEEQDPEAFATGVDAIVDAGRRVALQYFEDGSVKGACPPLAALLHIMAYDTWEGLGIDAPRVRGLFSRAAVVSSEWYRERLRTKQRRDEALCRRNLAALEAARDSGGPLGFDVEARLAVAREQLERVCAERYVEELVGTIGADPFAGQVA